MERKIGEIFEYNGEWYQCVEGNCAYCFINDEACEQRIINDVCKLNRIFKKLEKVGEPYDDCGTILQRFKIYTNVTNVNTKGLELHIYSNNTIGIEIKQNKEDMKENYKAEDTPLTRLVGRYVNNLIDYKTFEEAVKELYFDKEESKQAIKEFDLEAAKAGKPVCTRDGRKARIICFDRNDLYAIVALIGYTEEVYLYYENGRSDEYQEYGYDLMMLPEKKEGWVNVYNADTTFYYVEGMVYNTKDEAIQKAKEELITEQREKIKCVDTIKICWEE